MTKSVLSHKIAASTAIAVLLSSACICAPLAAQTDNPPPKLAPIPPTRSLGEPTRTVKLESDDPEIRYQNGAYFNRDGKHIRIRDKDGRITGDFDLHPLEKDTAMYPPAVHDVAIYQDGSIVASWIYRLQRDSRPHFSLVHYDPAGNFLEQIDMGNWRATRICIADDKSIWTLSGEEEFGHSLYSPDEGVLRNYKFGSGLIQAAVPRSSFPQENQNFYASGNAGIDCSGGKVHALTSDGQWIEYRSGAGFTITKIEPFPHSTFGDLWRLAGFACLDGGHAYAVIHSVPGDPFRRMLAELLPSADGKTLRWVEVPPEKLPANNHPPDPSYPPGPDKPEEPIVVTGVLGADHENGEQLVYRTSKDETVLWSKPSF